MTQVQPIFVVHTNYRRIEGSSLSTFCVVHTLKPSGEDCFAIFTILGDAERYADELNGRRFRKQLS